MKQEYQFFQKLFAKYKMNMFNTSTLELSSAALKHNLRFIRRRMKKGVRLCSVIKGNAYGHGFCEYVGMSMELGVDYFGVHAAEEAHFLYNNIEIPPEIFIMGSIEEEAIEWAIEKGIEFTVFDFHRFEKALQYSKKLNKKAKVHLEMETGMRRTGFEKQDWNQLCELFKTNSEYLFLQGVFTHFAGAESQANQFRIIRQISEFDEALRFFESQNLRPVYHHTACSAVLLNYPESTGNMVRVGILQYGFMPNEETHIRFCGESDKNPDVLRRIIRWKTNVMAVKEVKKGNFVGYGTSYLAHKNMRLAVLPVGYSHGYSRSLSNLGSVLINGKICPVVGTINMNSLTADITRAGTVNPGDEVVLIGRQHKREITVNSFSEQSKLMNYELLTRLPASIPRIVI